MIGSIYLPYRGSIIFVSRFEANVGGNGGQFQEFAWVYQVYHSKPGERSRAGREPNAFGLPGNVSAASSDTYGAKATVAV